MSVARHAPVDLAGFPPDEKLTRELAHVLDGMGIPQRHWSAATDAARGIEEELERGRAGPSVVLLRGEDAVSAARQIRAAAPATQLVFLAEGATREHLHAELRSANLGHGWSFVAPDPVVVAETIREAITTSGQRRMVRTTLDRGDVRVSAEQMDAQRVRSLAISDALLGAILREAVDAIMGTDERGRIVTANPSAERLFGYGAELLGMSVNELIPDFGELAPHAGRLTSRTGRCKDGSPIPVDVTVSRVVVGSSPAGWALVARDARDRLAAEAELRAQAEMTATILNGIREGVYVVDAFGNLLFMNPAAEEMLGWKASELVEHNVHDVIHRSENLESIPAAECRLLGAVRTGVPVRSEERFVRRDGTIVPVECSVTPVRLGGEVIGGVFNFHDLTHYHHLQDRLRNEKEELAQTNRAKDDFIATISHELRTPITAILGWLQLVTEGDLDREQMTEALEAIETGARAQAQIVSDLLDVSRVISGKLHLEMIEVDLNAVAIEAAATLRPTAEEQSVTLAVSPGSEPAPVCGDPARLRQVVWNLVTNAIKFTREGGRVTLAVEPGEEMVRLVVSDTGVGIPPEDLSRIFDRYRQGAGGMARGGLGLGLAIVRSLVERHGGRVDLHSELDRGTTVTVEIPRWRQGEDCAIKAG